MCIYIHVRAVADAFKCVYYVAIARKCNKIHVCSPNSTSCKKSHLKAHH